MTSAELQECIRIVLESLKDSTKSIADLPSMAKAAETDCIEVSGGRKISIADLRKTLSGMSKAQLEALLASLNQLETSVGVSEDERKAAESLRDNAEQARVAAETARGKAETARASAEIARRNAENTRESNETARDTAEIARTKAETARQAAEQTRQTKESSRQTAEQSRVSAETKRVAAENAREEAESARAAEFASLSTASQAATKAANNAATAANGAATAATEAATAASNAASDVNDAKTNANNAATAANAAATNANNAANSLATTIAGKQDKLSTSEDLSISAGNMLALTDMAKKRLFIDLWNEACVFYPRENKAEAIGGYDPANAPDAEHPFLLRKVWMTYEEAMAVLEAGRYNGNIQSIYCCNKHIRTNLPSYKMSSIYATQYPFYYCQKLEVANADNMVFTGTIYGCPKLHTINNLLDVNIKNFILTETFNNGLVNLTITSLTHSIDVASHYKLTRESFSQIVSGAANTSAIFIKVHPDVYAKLTGDTTNEAAAALSAEELAQWQAVTTAAAAKNISFTTE